MSFRTFVRTLCLVLTGTCGMAHAATTPCRLADFPQEVRCGQIERPLDPAQPGGRSILVHYAILPSDDKNKLPDPVFVLAGGPGQSAIAAAGWAKSMLARLNRRRDIVLVDQRGTGKSAPLRCPEEARGVELSSLAQSIARIQACRQALEKLPYGDLRFFSTSIAVGDLEAVRRAEHYDSINLLGVSYGTRVGLEYLRQYPHGVRRIILDGVVPPDLQRLGEDAPQALQRVFDQCLHEQACNRAYPDLSGQWQALLASLPQKVQFVHPRLGTLIEMEMSVDQVAPMVLNALYTPENAAALPYALTQARQRNYAPLVSLSGSTAAPTPLSLYFGMHLSVWCAEAYAQPVRGAGNILSRTSEAMYAAVCADWPKAVIPEGFAHISASPVPALLLSGGRDPVTPAARAQRVAEALGAQARHLAIDQAGHGVLKQGCIRDVVYRFIHAQGAQEAAQVDAGCVRQIPAPLFWQPPTAPAASPLSRNRPATGAP